jgi:hypothetical protein
MVTYLRRKLTENSREAEGKGTDMLMRKLKQGNNDHEIRNRKDSKRRRHVRPIES